MQVVTSILEMQREAGRLRIGGKKVGLVPTMGYLHDGHLRLIEHARKICDTVIVSIFVNPTQFGPNEDFSRYPRDFERDENLAIKAGIDFLFTPATEDMYVSGYGTWVEEQDASHVLEGMIRPTHFRGVTTIVAKLFNICKPHIAVFGQKDAQQVFIVKKMVRDLNIDVSIEVVPIVREPDGLAMSSRNVYLSREERSNATILHESLNYAEKKIMDGARNVPSLQSEMLHMIREKGSPTVDYVAFVDPQVFRETNTIVKPAVLIALAARFGKTRLIDNALVVVEET
jgi:pantoate--beta-alanine ligase